MGRQGRSRVAIEAVSPEIDAGRFPAKRSVGEKVAVEADIFADGHDAVACVIRYRHEGESDWTEVPMLPLLNDRWRAEFVVTELGLYRITIEAWVDRLETWRRQLAKRVEAGQDVTQEQEVGARMVEAGADRSLSVTYGRQVEILVEPQRARYGAWYEMFPRSAGKQGKHGTFRDVEDWLPYISGMGFDVLYFPPIHP
ncbi:MAG TPA: maltotransferase domain-containing protein, partial [Acidimicrobiales bacterium]|nr:maltotransferase domain-containing protein [Acidimicrobiales bacterium]